LRKSSWKKGPSAGTISGRCSFRLFNAQNRLTQLMLSIKNLEIEIARLTGKLERLL
jgi:hypothetical protein